jgi:hypothetical protein
MATAKPSWLCLWLRGQVWLIWPNCLEIWLRGRLGRQSQLHPSANLAHRAALSSNLVPWEPSVSKASSIWLHPLAKLALPNPFAVPLAYLAPSAPSVGKFGSIGSIGSMVADKGQTTKTNNNKPDEDERQTNLFLVLMM